MFNLFSKEKNKVRDSNHLSLISVAALLIHSAKIDEDFTEKERFIIKKKPNINKKYLDIYRNKDLI